MRQVKIVKQVTNRDAKSLDKYFKKLVKLDLLLAMKK